MVSDEDDLPEIETLALPLDGWHRARGARMVEFAGYWMPIQYEGIVAEHLWTRQSAGLFDVSHMGQLHLSGEGVEAAFEALVPADIAGLGVGRMRYSLLLNEEGGILDDLMISRWGQGLYVVVNGAVKWDDIAHIRMELPDEIVLNHMEDHALLALQGPKALAALRRHVSGEYPLDTLKFMMGGRFTIACVEAWISRSGYTGEDGFEISIPADAAETVAELLCGEPEVKPIGLGARDSLRLEAGLPLYGHDLDPETTPIAADLGFALSKRRREEANFPGARRVLAERESGPALKRVGLTVEGRQPVREGADVLDATGKPVGRVTSGGFSPSLQQPIAMAYVPAALAAPGTRITLGQRGKTHAATVTPMPFVPHRYVR
ncbi:glycine cleavage system aminomethyltransferase GcvT [Sphingomonas sp. GlSt437]|uniref:glycine cleavage system aminomethyltransferase GcvT n=1 Tax=Sphingomonas sp. GlSt437 TaxID=3389970 RepID=UPI003A8430DE